jgi:hypothetical protein
MKLLKQLTPNESAQAVQSIQAIHIKWIGQSVKSVGIRWGHSISSHQMRSLTQFASIQPTQYVQRLHVNGIRSINSISWGQTNTRNQFTSHHITSYDTPQFVQSVQIRWQHSCSSNSSRQMTSDDMAEPDDIGSHNLVNSDSITSLNELDQFS